MSRLVAIITIVAYFFSGVPASARRQSDSAVTLETVSTLNSACDLISNFREIHAVVIAIALKAHDAGQTSMHLHRTSRWIPYKHIEVEVGDVERTGKSTLSTLAHLSLALDQLPDNDAKAVSVNLASAYQNAVEQAIDYSHASVDYERMENSFSNFQAKTTLTFSIPSYWKLRTYWDNITRHHLDERYTEIGDAIRSLKIPEYLYAKSCTPSSPAAAVAVIDDPCDVADRLAYLRTVISKMGKEAKEAGVISRNLHKTQRWRPYKQVENDWIDLTSHVNPTLDELLDLSLRLNDAPDGDKKDATLNLIANYQNAVEKFVDYTHFAIYYERNQNEVTPNSYAFMLDDSQASPGGLKLRGGVLGFPTGSTRSVLSFGTQRDNTKANMETTALNLFDAKYTEADDTFRSFKLPEYRFSKACHTQPPAIAIAHISDPCTIQSNILTMRINVLRLGEEVRDMDHTVRSMHHTSRSRPYWYIENKWIDVTRRSSPMLDTLSDLLVALDASPDSSKKKAAVDLAAAYQTSVENFIDYAHLAVYFERAENSVGASFYEYRGRLSFGVEVNAVRTGGNLVARDYLESKILMTNDSYRSLKLPEYRYGTLCKMALSPLKVLKIGKR